MEHFNSLPILFFFFVFVLFLTLCVQILALDLRRASELILWLLRAAAAYQKAGKSTKLYLNGWTAENIARSPNNFAKILAYSIGKKRREAWIKREQEAGRRPLTEPETQSQPEQNPILLPWFRVN